ncbi:hypothetical protein C8R41DRAFT_867335 [Lentinula lateritia]|uniref:Uncharacterized protein n=1 Tax=Lentinula lateritia TaxID=40482 RepID=A0ABQ8VIJ6_9AGAR|nr:hypothetical protein C8R41DRAFT_867335 [Lentinula lateritia]
MAADSGTLDPPSIVSASKNPPLEILTLRYGGFPISHRDALAWANRVRAANGLRLLTDAPHDSGSIMGTLNHVVEAAGGVKCNPHGRIEAGKPYEKYIIITQYEVGEWLSVNGVVEPSAYLVEGETETIGKELLRREGIAHEPFTSCFTYY